MSPFRKGEVFLGSKSLLVPNKRHFSPKSPKVGQKSGQSVQNSQNRDQRHTTYWGNPLFTNLATDLLRESISSVLQPAEGIHFWQTGKRSVVPLAMSDCDPIHKIWSIHRWIYSKQDLGTWWKVQKETGEFEFSRSTRTKTSGIDIWEPFYETCWHDSYPRWHNPPIHSVGCRCKKTTEEVVIRKWALLIQFSSHSNNTIEA